MSLPKNLRPKKKKQYSKLEINKSNYPSLGAHSDLTSSISEPSSHKLDSSPTIQDLCVLLAAHLISATSMEKKENYSIEAIPSNN